MGKSHKTLGTEVAALQSSYSEASDKLELAECQKMQTEAERDQLSRKLADVEGTVSKLEEDLADRTRELSEAEDRLTSVGSSLKAAAAAFANKFERDAM